MKKEKRIACAVIIGMIALTATLAKRDSVSQPSSSQSTLKRKTLIRPGKITAVDAFTSALRIAGVPGGISHVIQCGDDITYPFPSSGPTLEDVLHTVESTSGQYAWNVNDGLVNVFPTAGDPALLRLRIRTLQISKAQSIDEAANQVFSSHEVQKRINELGLTPGLTRLGMSDLERAGTRGQSVEHPYTLKFSNITLRESLNAISRAHGTAVWEYRERHCGSAAQFQIQFLVR